MSEPRKEQLADGVALWLGDMLEVLPTLGMFDACVTDPPYGICADLAASKNKGKWGWSYYGHSDWDNARPPPVAFELMLSRSRTQIIWGGNYFTDLLRPSMQWLMWDKGQREFSLADFEMAWSSQNKASRAISYPRARALQDGKEHPTQKPLEVMAWCLDQLPADIRTIIDPFMGSGTTGVAAVNRGFSFTGIDCEPRYFEIACRRISEALKRPRLPLEEPRRVVQETLGL